MSIFIAAETDKIVLYLFSLSESYRLENVSIGKINEEPTGIRTRNPSFSVLKVLAFVV